MVYGPCKLSPTILGHTWTAKHCCAACGWLLCLLFKALICALNALKTSSSWKVASSQNNTEQAKCMPSTLWLTNYCANATRRRWPFDCNNCTLCAWNGSKFSPCCVQWTVLRDLPVAKASACTLVPRCRSTKCSISSSNMDVRAVHSDPILSLIALKEPCSTKFWCNKANVWWFGCRLVGCLLLYSSTLPQP